MNQNTKKRIAKVLSVTTSITTTLWMSGAAMLAPMTTKAAVTINEGDIFRASNDYKVYIAKYVGGKSFKRWFVGPQMFDFYKHLGFAKVKVVDPSVAAAFTESKLVRAAGDDKVYYIGDATAGVGAAKKWVPTLAAFQAAGFDWDGVYVINSAEAGWYTMGANFDGSTVVPSTGPVAGAISTSLATDNPAGGVLASSSLYNNVLKVTFWAPAAGGATISSLTVTKYGLMANSNVSGVSVWDASGMRHGAVASSLSSDNKSTIGFGANPITVPAGGSVTLTVKVNLSTATSGTVYFGIASASDVAANTTIGGAFPLVGNLFTIADGSTTLGNVHVTMQTPGGNNASGDAANVDVGDLQKEVGIVKFTQTNGLEDIQVEQITFYIEGDVTDAQLANWKLFDVSGNVLASAAKSVDRYVTMNLATPYVVPKGQNKNLSVKVDFVDGANRWMKLHIQNDYDVVVRGVSTRAALQPYSTGVTVLPDTYASNSVFKMRQGTLSVSKASDSPTTNVTQGQTDALLAKFNLRASGEDMEIRKMDLWVIKTGSDTTVPPALSGNLSVRSADGAITYLTISGSDSYLYADNANRYDLSTYLQLKSNQDTKLAVYANIPSTATSSASYTVKVQNFYAKRLSSIDYVDLPDTTTDYAANPLSVITTDASAAMNTAVGNVKSPASVSNVKIASFVVQGGTAEDAKITNVKIGVGGTGNYTDKLSNLTLKVNGVVQGNVISAPVDASNSFSVNINLPKSTPVVFDVYADLKSNAATFSSEVKEEGVTIVGLSTGNTIYRPVSGAGDLALQTVTIADAALTITKDSSSPAEQIVTPANGVLMGNWKFAADNEDLKLSKIVYTVTAGDLGSGASQASNFGTLYLKDGSTTLASAMLVGTDATFSFPYITIPASGNKILSLYADLTTSGVQNANSIARWVIKSDASDTTLNVSGSAGQLAPGAINGSGTNTNIAPSAKFLYENSKAVIAAATDTPTGVKVPSNPQDLFKFTITNSGTRDMSVTSITVTVNASGLGAGSTAAVKTWQLYDGSTKLAENTTVAKELSGNTTSAAVVFGQANDGAGAYFDDFQISAGASKTFTMKADTSTVLTGISTVGASVYLTMKVNGTSGSATDTTWNTGDVVYGYSTSIGGRVGEITVSDSYPVTGGTLQYTK